MAGEITIADIQARVPAETWGRVFDRDGLGAADLVFAQTCINDAISEAEMRLEASLPGYLAAKSSAIADAIKRRIAVMTLYNGVQLNPSTAGQSDKEPSPFLKIYKDALEFFDRLARDDRNRTTDGTKSRPQAQAANAIDSSSRPTNPFTRSADGRDPSMF